MTRRHCRGQMLVIVLWVMGVVTVAVGSLVFWATHELRLGSVPLQLIQSRAVLEAGVREASALLHRDDAAVDAANACGLVQPDGWDARPLEHITVGQGTFSVGQTQQEAWCGGLLDEERKLSLNVASISALRQLIAAAAPDADAAALAAAILDWRDEAPGAFCAGATPACHNGPFASVDELRLVPGMTPPVFAALQPYVTVYGSGQVNANTAAPLVLNALGYDGQAIAEARAGQPFDAAHPPPPGLATASTIFTIPVEATVAAVQARVEAVVDRQGRILAWHRT